MSRNLDLDNSGNPENSTAISWVLQQLDRDKTGCYNGRRKKKTNKKKSWLVLSLSHVERNPWNPLLSSSSAIDKPFKYKHALELGKRFRIVCRRDPFMVVKVIELNNLTEINLQVFACSLACVREWMWFIMEHQHSALEDLLGNTHHSVKTSAWQHNDFKHFWLNTLF